MSSNKDGAAGSTGEESKDYLTPEEAVEQITELVIAALGSAAGSNSVILATDLKTILDKVATKEAIEVRGIQGDIVAILNRSQNGVHATGIWTRLRRNPALQFLSLEAVEEALADMLTNGHAYPDKSGALPVWKLGRAPEEKKGKK